MNQLFFGKIIDKIVTNWKLIDNIYKNIYIMNKIIFIVINTKKYFDDLIHFIF
jgi:hypothetical protein